MALIYRKNLERDIMDCLTLEDWQRVLVKAIIDKQIVVDAVPVVHGKWLHDNHGVNFCSECLKFAYEDDEYRMIWHTRYCPHCGAKMDEHVGNSDKLKDGDSDAGD